MLADPANGPKAQFPDGYGAKTTVLRLRSTRTLNPEYPISYLMVRPWQLSGLAIGSSTHAGETQTDGRAASWVSIYSAKSHHRDRFFGEYAMNWTEALAASQIAEQARFLCASVQFQYVGPRGDDLKGIVYYNTSTMGYTCTNVTKMISSSDPTLGAVVAGRTAWPFMVDETTHSKANYKWSPQEVIDATTSKSVPVGVDFEVKLYPRAPGGEGFYNVALPTTENSYNTDNGEGKVEEESNKYVWQQVPPAIAESLPNLLVAFDGTQVNTDLYRVTIVANFECTAQDSFTGLVGTTSVPLKPNIVASAPGIWQRMTDAATDYVATKGPDLAYKAMSYAGDFASAYIMDRVRR